jgi:hypothetical protein
MVPLKGVSDSPHSGVEVSVVARVALSFSVNANPEALMQEATEAEMPLTERVEKAVDRFTRWLQAPIQPFACGCAGENLDCAELSEALRPEPMSAHRPRRPEMAVPEAEKEAVNRPSLPAGADWAFKL